jgi:hypothetical protein
MKVDSRTVVVGVPPAQAFAPVRRIGGAPAGTSVKSLWERTWLAGPPGRRRGDAARPPDAEACVVGDIIDGWTVRRTNADRRLRLSADLKLPGRGWLEFEVMHSTAATRSRFDKRHLRPARAHGTGLTVWHSLRCTRDVPRDACRHRPPAAGEVAAASLTLGDFAIATTGPSAEAS